jgi:NADH-quinone oxidoreductase subunit L
MKLAMSVLALLAIVGGFLQIPKITHVVDHFLEPTFHDSALYAREPSDGMLTFGLVLGTVVAISSIALAYYVWVLNPGLSARVRARLAALYTLFVNKWFFDELIDALVVRPSRWFGSFAQQTFERVVVNGVLVGGTSGVVRAGSSAVRAAQTGFLRYYAALVVLGMVVVAFYFLASA